MPEYCQYHWLKGKWFNKSPWCPKCQFIAPVPNSMAAGGPYWVLISQKVGSLFQSMGVLISLADSNVLVWIPSEGQMTKLMDSLSSSDDRIGGCPQQVRCHLVLIWSILDPLTWFLTHFGPLQWILPVETSLSLGPIKSLSQKKKIALLPL